MPSSKKKSTAKRKSPPISSPQDQSNAKPLAFKPSGKSHQKHRNPVYCLVWSKDTHVDHLGKKYHYLATCGHNVVTIYEIETGNPKGLFNLVQSYKDKDPEEIFYACAYGGRSKYWGRNEGKVLDKGDGGAIENEVGPLASGDSLSICAGSINIRNADDTASSSGTSSLMSDQKPSAKSKRPRTFDQGTELMDGEKAQSANYLSRVDQGDGRLSYDGPQLLCVAGDRAIIKIIDPVQQRQVCSLKGHGSDIYDLKVSPVDEFLLISASVDESIRLWNLKSFACLTIFGGHHGHREAVLSISWHPLGTRFASSGMDKSIRLWNIDSPRIKEAIQASQKLTPERNRDSFHPVCEQYPYFATHKVHLNFVDCVQFLGNMILSKSTYNSIVLWVPNIPEEETVKSSAYKPPSDVVALRTFELNNCNIWFVRFCTDSLGRYLAVGNINGEIDIFDIDVYKKTPSQMLKPFVQSTIRMLAFSPDCKTLVACNDSATICKWDEV